MSSATEIPDFVSGVTQALGINRLWQTSEQADAEKRKSEQHDAGESAEDEAKRTKQTQEDEAKGEVAPVSIAQEREKEQASEEGERKPDGAADHDMDVHRITRRAPEPSAGKGKGYEWPMPTSLKDNQAKKKYDTAPTQDDSSPAATEQAQERSQSEPIPDGTGKPSKSSFIGSLRPFLNQQRTTPGSSAFPTSAQSAPLSKENPFERPRPQSSSSARKLDRPKQQRQFTMPVNRQPAPPEAKSKSAARSRWQVATYNLRFPLRRRKTDRREAATRGAEVITTLAAGAPAANLLASHMLSDEHSHHRIPLIVDLLKISITDSEQAQKGHISYRIDLTYGEGPTQMKWTINREHRDFQALHSRLRLLYLRRRDKLPDFPHSTFPFWLGHLGGSKYNEKSEIKDRIPQELGPGIAAGVGALAGAIGGGVPDMKKKDVQMMARIKLQEYLQQLAFFLGRARPGLNRLCKFLEISTLGIRLAAEGSYHGKEGWLVIAGLKGSNPPLHCDPRVYKRRHTPKWFMVRHSYIVCVEEMEGLNIYDVFLVDSDFKVEWNALPGMRSSIEESSRRRHHFFTITNGERKFKLGSESDKKMMQFIQSIQTMTHATPWAEKHRFNSFAPVRQNVQCQWLVDGRDYFWNVSRAILKARDVIYIHDWWLSPELHMRRPAANAQKWRLDRLLQRKAQEGVKIYVIIYQNVGTTVPIDSTHTKYSLLGLHPNIFVQRSPRHVGGLGGQNVFFWAHHEKIISIDHTVGFVGGLDLCFGRWDSPEHVLVDDKKPSGFGEGLGGKLIGDPQVWPGKDYSNPRIHDFFELDKPYEDMYDRQQTPRMPWHDISMQCSGQSARDIARHFVQRWNYLLRTKPPSKPTPILLPPQDFTAAELESLNLNGTCEMQLVRSCGQWSMGLQDKTETSICNAYMKCIEQSEHFVYIENQFFITASDCDGTKIENGIGNAIVNRIIRAHKEDTDWRIVIIIPLMPGFQNTIDSPDGSSLRLIMYAQWYSLCRGESSIFGKLRAVNIDPEDYISVYGLRGWGKIGDQNQLVTEQVYIHAKIMIVDDRVAIIGSANINERSMRGNRDSEVAAVIRDTEQYEVTMAGKPFMVGKFAHTLRMRLQLEHLGVNTDDFEQRTYMMDGMARTPTQKVESWDKLKRSGKGERIFSFNHDDSRLDPENYHTTENTSSDDDDDDELAKHKAWYRKRFHTRSRSRSPAGTPTSSRSRPQTPKRRNSDSSIHKTEHSHQAHTDLRKITDSPEPIEPPKLTEKSKIGRPTVTTSANPLAGAIPPNMQGQTSHIDRAEELEQAKRDPDFNRKSTSTQGATSDETLSEVPLEPHLSLPKPLVHHGDGGSILPDPPKKSRVTERAIPKVNPYNFVDPLSDSFFWDQWNAVAEHNTEVYRRVFHPMPDNDVKTWSEYKEYYAFGERLAKAEGGERGKMQTQQEQSGASGPVGALSGGAAHRVLTGLGKKEHGNRDDIKEYSKGGKDIHESDMQRIREDLKETGSEIEHEKGELKEDAKEGEHEVKHFEGAVKHEAHEAKESLEHVRSNESATKRRRAKSNVTKAGQFTILPRDTMEELLSEVQGHLVVWPMDWLCKEDQNGNFLYNIDKVQPMEIYD